MFFFSKKKDALMSSENCVCFERVFDYYIADAMINVDDFHKYSINYPIRGTPTAFELKAHGHNFHSFKLFPFHNFSDNETELGR